MGCVGTCVDECGNNAGWVRVLSGGIKSKGVVRWVGRGVNFGIVRATVVTGGSV